MTVPEIMATLQSLGSDSIKKVLLKHGVKEPFFGVKIEHLKPIQKQVKKDYKLAKDLFATGNADAMYLAGLIADDELMTPDDLNSWASLATSANISEYTVPWVAAGSRYGWQVAMQWIDAPQEHIAAAGWATLAGLAAIKPDAALDLPAMQALLIRVVQTIHTAQNRERYAMNSFVIAAGTYITSLTQSAIATAGKIGTVTVDMNGTACKVPDAADYITKAIAKGRHGTKKKTLKC